ncbi:MAG: T9SS type A sorting domain-containing protein [Candidatus Zixiibacteriota bacterium]|nr:MAG: T9SS type A sorting domain-containing protein [candidate division Zixibacteria bacterium]
MLGNREIIKFIRAIVFCLILGAFSAVNAQDPGNPDSLIIGNFDGTPILAGLNVQIVVPVYLKTDDSIDFMHLPVATDNDYITTRDGGFLYEPLSLWDDASFLNPDTSSPSAGFTSQGILGFAYLFDPRDPQNFLYTDYQWWHIADYYMTTTSDISVLGDTTYMLEGINPANGNMLMGLPGGVIVVIPQTIWGGIYFPPNTPPAYTEPTGGTLPINEQFGICMTVTATDEDDDDLVLTVDFGPTDYTFEELVNIPGEISYEFCWFPLSGMAGTYPLTFTVNDGAGGVIDLDMILEVAPTELVIHGDSTLPGANVSLPVSLNNQGISSAVGAFEILIGWNPLALTFNSVVRSGRTGSFEYFHVNPNSAGDGTVRIVGIADLSFGDVTPPLQPDTGTIFFIDFSVSNDEALIGVDLPVEFINLDETDNTVTDSTGYLLIHPDLINGLVSVIGPDDVLTGDINLNGVPYEVGDIVLFINHILNPSAFPFNAVQREASDINADGIPETIADLVLLINIVNGNVPPPKIEPTGGNIVVTLTESGETHYISANSAVDLGAILLKLSHNPNHELTVNPTGDFTVASNDSNGEITILAYLPEGGGIPAGEIDLFQISELGEEFEISEIAASDSRGRLLNVVSRIGAILPDKYELAQNYPNPFNAATKISFALPEPQLTTLEIFNVSGQKVGTLIDGYLDAGKYDITWNGIGDNGKTVSSGVYLYKLHTDSRSITMKMTLLK